MAHAEASARTVDAAVTAAATQLGLRPDQVDIEVLEDPVPSTFGYIGTPARVRVTPRSGSSSDGSTSTGSSASEPVAGGSGPAVASSAETSGAGSAASADAVSAATDTPAQVAGDAAGPAATAAPDAASGVGVASADATGAPVSAGAAGSAAAQAPAGVADGAAAPDPGADRQVSADPGASNASLSQATQVASSTSTATPAPTSTPAAGSAAEASSDPVLSSPPRSGSDPASTSTDPEAGPTSGRPADANATAKNDSSDLSLTIRSDPPNLSAPTSISGADTAGQVANAGIDEPTPSISTPEAAAVPAAQSSSALASGNGDRTSDGEAGRATSTLPASSAAPEPPSSESSRETRSPRRTYRDEPIEPAMVEADTERAGDFLEGLLDALDVDGDITTWVDEVGGHIDLEGSELDVLVGSNGETLDALQELTRLAVLRQSKRRARLLLDINGFRARQREQLVSIVKATAEQVIRTREDHEFQPMTPAERKIVHDAVAAIDGARTESLGEDPHRRVVIRPA